MRITCGVCGFRFAGSADWNSLPSSNPKRNIFTGHTNALLLSALLEFPINGATDRLTNQQSNTGITKDLNRIGCLRTYDLQHTTLDTGTYRWRRLLVESAFRGTNNRLVRLLFKKRQQASACRRLNPTTVRPAQRLQTTPYPPPSLFSHRLQHRQASLPQH